MLLLTRSSLPHFQITISGGPWSCQDFKCDFSVFNPTPPRRRRRLSLPVRWWASVRDSSPKAFLVFYHPSVHAVIDLHGRMDEVEASAKASGHYPQRERQRKEHNTHTHLQIRGNQQCERRFSVKSGAQRWYNGPQNPIFSLCPCVTGRNRWAC